MLCAPLTRGADRGTCVDSGSADYSQPVALLWQQLRSEAPYQIQRVPMGQALWKFRSAGRAIVRQRLDLSETQALRLGEQLVQKTAGRAPTYAYDILHRNCVTELRDALFAAGIGQQNAPDAATYRQLLESSLRQGWSDVPMLFAMDLAAGRSFDARVTTTRARLFLPELLSDAFAPESSLSTSAPRGTWTPVRTRANALEALLSICLALAAALSVWQRAPTIARSVARWFVALVLGTLGSIVWMVAAATPNLGVNENMLVLVPTDYLLICQGSRFRLGYCAARLLSVLAFAAFESFAYVHRPVSLISYSACLPLIVLLVAATGRRQAKRPTRGHPSAPPVRARSNWLGNLSRFGVGRGWVQADERHHGVIRSEGEGDFRGNREGEALDH